MSRFQNLQTLLFQAVDLQDADERRRFIETACAGYAALRAELEELLAYDAESSGRVETLADRLVPISASLDESARVARPGARLGGYELIREIGKGGMGAVFLAERAGEGLRHRVAIKVIRGFPTSDVLERLRRERDLLASLRHPNIARFFDGGTTSEGQPYLVMEHVEGVVLNTWLAQRQPSVATRLRLFQALCSAVQHAHRQLIIHRDIKPANVLVRDDGDPVLLDFGIGKVLADGVEAGDGTAVHPLTPAYASPEQLQGRAATTQSDVYGLGLLLYEILSGQPLRQANGRTASVSVSRTAAGSASWMRRDAKLLRGDLDNIVGKCLSEQPERRYASVEALDADIQAWFEGRPVKAAPDAWHYRLRKLVGRHPVAVGATITVVVVLSILSARLAIERDNALLAQEQSRLDAEAANQSAAFMVELLKQASPDRSLGREISVQTLMTKASALLEEQTFSRPAIKSRLERALGEINLALGQVPASEAVLESAVRRLEQLPAPTVSDRIELASSLRQRCRARITAGRLVDARDDCQRATEIMVAVLPPDDPSLGEAWMTQAVAEVNIGLFDEAEENLRTADAHFARLGQDFELMRARVRHNLGWLRQHQGRYEESADILADALARKQAHLGPVHPDLGSTLQALATSVMALGRLSLAIERLQMALAQEIQFVGEPSDGAATARNELGLALMDAGRFDESDEQFRIGLSDRQVMAPEGSMEMAHLLNNRGWLFEARGLPGRAGQFRTVGAHARSTRAHRAFDRPFQVESRAHSGQARPGGRSAGAGRLDRRSA